MGFMEMESDHIGKFQTKHLLGTFKTESGILVILEKKDQVSFQ